MRPPDCPDWHYDNHPARGTVLPQKVKEVLIALGAGSLDTLQLATDTRPVHRQLFVDLTPAGLDYFAGHYRGEMFLCLRQLRVMIPADPRVGYPPASVGIGMAEVARTIRQGVAMLDRNSVIPDAHIPRAQKVLQVVIFACRVFEVFLRVHPYADGNGHAARFLIWALLGRYGYWPRRWPIEPKPPDPPYSQLISDYRSGNHEPLEEFVLKTVA
jgi:fido (protein-threonine AMPylation protein)